MNNLTLEMYRDSRRIIIEIVLNTDMSKHFSLMTTLKTKLGNSFPTDSIEDRVLILSIALRTSDMFKVVRDGRSTFSKFMDKENTNSMKAYVNYIQVVCRPLLTTFMILIQDEDVNAAIFKEGIDKNRKTLEQS